MIEDNRESVENLEFHLEDDSSGKNISSKKTFWEKIPFFKKPNKKTFLFVILIVSFFSILIGTFSMKGYSLLGWNKKPLSVLDIEAKSHDDYIDTNEVFEIKTKNGSLDEVRKHIYVEPAVKYEIKEKTKNLYELTTYDLPSDTIVNVDYVDNQVIENKWAFQSTKDLKVNSVYPANGSTGVSIYSDIEVVFSYPDLEDINASIDISPEVSGEFVSNGRVWVLHPEVPLQQDTNYTITIRNDIKRGDQTLQETVQTSFSTKSNIVSSSSSSLSNSVSLSYSNITIDGISTFRPTDPIMFRLSNNQKNKTITNVEVLKLKSANDFEKYLKKEPVDMESLGFVLFHNVSEGLYAIDQSFGVGYYVVRAYLSDEETLFFMPVQISDLSVFLLNTQNDLLVWTGSNNNLLKDIPVTYEGKTISTDQDGLALIENYNQLEKQMKYVKVGDENPVYIGVNTEDYLQYAPSYIYTDRPLYKNTDEIQFWGYIPLKYYEELDDFSVKDFVFSIDEVTVPIEILKDGTFIGTYSLDNYNDGSITLKLSYKNQSVATRWVVVRQYEKENYDFSIDMEKNYVEAGQPFHFTVSVSHISGIMVPNKEIKATINGVDYTAYTDGQGVASFDIPTALQNDDSKMFQYEYGRVFSSLSEYASQGISIQYYVVNRFTNADIEYNKETKIVTATISNMNLEKDQKKISNPFDLVDKNLPYSGEVRVVLRETSYSRFLSGYYYNQFTKETLPRYNWTDASSDISDETVSVKNGKLKYQVSYEEKETTEDRYYNYTLYLYFTDSKGNNVVVSRQLFSTYIYSVASQVGYYGDYGRSPYLDEEYHLYTYHFDMEGEGTSWYSTGSKLSVGDDINGSLYHYSGSQELEKNPLLIVKYKNTILDKEVYMNQEITRFSFTDDDRPGISIAGAYFKDGVFYRLPSKYRDYQEEDSKLDVEIIPDSTQYKPGEKVTVDIHVRQKSKGKKAKVNVSVVDEGIFKAWQDDTNLLSTLYSNRYFYQYLYSTYRDYSLSYSLGGGGGSTAGGERADFGDTLYFEMIETDKNGNAKISFQLNDSVTSFRITAHAVTDNVDAGVNHTNITSSLPLSVTFVELRGLKQSDDVVLNASSLGSTTDKVHYEFSIDGVEQVIQKEALVGQTVYASFGKLPVGEYKVHIKASSGNESDAVTFPIHVKVSQVEISVKNTFSIQEKSKITPTKNPIILELYRDSFRNYEQFLDVIRNTNEERLDTKISYAKALIYENRYLEEKNVVNLDNIDAFKAENGWRFLPAEEVSYELTALVSYYYEELRYDNSIYYNMIQKNQSISEKLKGYVVLAAMKEPILDDLNALADYDMTVEDRDIYLLAYLLLGDYKTVRNHLSDVSNSGLRTYLSTFVDKEHAAENITELMSSDIADRYLYFSIISYFENNNVELDTKEKVTVSYGKEKETVELTSLGKKVLKIYQEDLKTLNIISKYKDISYNYYYEGALDEIDDSLKSQIISTSVNNNQLSLGDTVLLNVDLSSVPKDTSLKIYLPNGLRLSSGFNSKIAYIQSNRIDYLSIRVYDKSENMIQIPLYAASPGNYVIEPVVIKQDNYYILSNPLEVNIQG